MLVSKTGRQADNQDSRLSRSHLRKSRLRRALSLALVAATSLATAPGCGMLRRLPDGPHDTTTSYHESTSMRIEYPEVATCASEPEAAAKAAQAPRSLEDPASLPVLEMTLAEAVNRAVEYSPVLRTIGGSIVSAPATASTKYDPALSHASPNTGVEAALSAFDAQLLSSLGWNNIDQPANIQSGGLGAAFTPAVTKATQSNYATELSKTTATGAAFAIRNVINYEHINRPFRQFPSDYVGWVEAEIRQPLMQGGGTEFNRIAGPNSGIGQYNGVLIARVAEDIALADFEASMIQLTADVEQAYWDLATAYRVLEATAKGRESALQTFQYQQVRLEVGTGRRDEEAQARSQFYQFEAQVQTALGGAAGLYALEQRLRYLIGLPATDNSLIRPSTELTNTKVVFDWESALGQSLARRVEVRRQRFNVKRREMELRAARLNRRPMLDFVGTYRWRGLGDDLIGPGGRGPNNNLAESITSGLYQEWGAGVEFSMPVGLRAASNAVAHAKLSLNRERAVLSETELRVSHDLSGSARQVDVTHQLLETNYNRYVADTNQVDVLSRRYRDGTDNIAFLLQAQRQLVTSEIEFYRSLTDYNLALRDFHQQKGSLLAYNGVFLAEGPWAAGAAQDAYDAGRYLTPRRSPEKVSRPRPLTSGPFDPSEPQFTAAQNTTPSMQSKVQLSSGEPASDVKPVSAIDDSASRIPTALVVEKPAVEFESSALPTTPIISEALRLPATAALPSTADDKLMR